ncbi:hypothetical protein KSMBR1_3909 [Candidatus Kuenenia stuttgartiensis]|uniref:Uncharacterized protein n=1 Tax=Kuenenia stuttgartiensis TaxID=174633 RepID=A0A2C9CL28_KUEST|nr:hypothetical protein KSMBR1_3909 [Candidatus Kuenenia stuttgartiensis]
MSKLIENSNSCSAFDYTYKIGYRYLGYYHDKQMNMVNLYIYSQTNKVFEKFTPPSPLYKEGIKGRACIVCLVK